MTFCLDSTIVKPTDNKDIKNAIILLHGYGGDGKDISMLTLNWKRHLPNTLFVCPNGHEKCEINPSGFQWFDLTKDDPKYILEQSIKAEKKLKKFIDEIKNEFNLENKIDLVFLDPPYMDTNYIKVIKLIKQKDILKKEHLLVIHREKNTSKNLEKNLNILENRTYGRSEIFFGKLFG